MTPFTGDDLKRYKSISMINVKEGDIGFIFLTKEALIARLEAAERANAVLLLVCQDDRQSYEYSEGVLSQAEYAMEAWRTAAGKS